LQQELQYLVKLLRLLNLRRLECGYIILGSHGSFNPVETGLYVLLDVGMCLSKAKVYMLS
jgi:hypothetical protein